MPLLGLAHTLGKFSEVTITIDKVIEGVGLNDHSIVEHGQFGAVLHCSQAVSYDNRSAVGHDSLERVIYEPLRCLVKSASRLIKKKNARLANDSSCDRNTLFLSTGELASSVAGKNVITSMNVFALLRGSPVIDQVFDGNAFTGFFTLFDQNLKDPDGFSVAGITHLLNDLCSVFHH